MGNHGTSDFISIPIFSVIHLQQSCEVTMPLDGTVGNSLLTCLPADSRAFTQISTSLRTVPSMPVGAWTNSNL